jgi:hypothetical protein
MNAIGTHVTLVLAIGVAAAISSAPAAGQGPSGRGYTLTPVTYGMQLKTPDGRVVFDYMTKKPPMSEVPLTSPSVACFHPVLTPSGERVTALAPDDHPHHRGIYLAWHDTEFRTPIDPGKMGQFAPAFGWGITTADFWGWGEFAPRENRIIQTASVTLAAANATQAEIAIANAWMVGKRKLLDETTTTRVSERDGAYLLDFTFRLAPVVDYVLHKQSFSGFNFQGRKDGESYFTHSAGTVQLPNPHYSVPELNWPPAPWYGYVVRVPNGKVVGAAVIDHPSNPPSTWHNSRNLWMVNPVIAALGPITIRPASPLTLRYRVVVHDGPTPTAVVEKLAAEFRAAR